MPAGATAEQPIRPRVCLVLSGGGARGIAHIGVLKVLEDMKIPIDCIAGTSMGAVVGGLYASGMSAHDIEKTMRSVDWQEAFHDAPPRRDLNFRRKQDDRNFLVRLPLGLKHGQIAAAQGVHPGAEARGDVAAADAAVQQQHGLRPAADASFAPWRRTWRRAVPCSWTRAIWPSPCAPAFRRPACFRRWNYQGGCWSTADWPRICPSTWRAA
jgi:hypothetical protein